MPAPSKTTDAEIVATARKLLERKGRDGFSMNDIAKAIGIRAPSLYGRFKDRAALIDAVELVLLHDLRNALARAVVPGEPLETLTKQAHAYRAFAKENPRGYSLVFDAGSGRSAKGRKARGDALAPAMPALSALVGESEALLAARVLTPFLHGFIAMELADAFRLGGGVDTAFDHGVSVVLQGLAAPRTPRQKTQKRQ